MPGNNQTDSGEDCHEIDLELDLSITASTNFRIKLFTFLYSLTPRTMMSSFSASFLIIFSFVQTLSWIILVDIKEGSIAEYIKYARIFPLVGSANLLLVYFSTMYVVSFFVLIYAVIMIGSIYMRNKSTSQFASSFINPIFWVLVIPVSEMYISLFFCNDSGHLTSAQDLKCWSLDHIVHILFLAIPIIVWALIVMIVTFVSSYSHAHNSNPFGHYPWYFEVVYSKLRFELLILACPAISSLDVKYYIYAVFSLFMVIYFSSLLWKTYPYYNPTISWIFAASSYVTILMSFILFLVCFLSLFNSSNDGFQMTLIPLCAIIISIPIAKISHVMRMIKLVTVAKVASAEELDMRVYILTVELLTKTHSTGVPTMYIQGYIDAYRQQCTDKLCPLYSTDVKKIHAVFSEDSSEDSKKMSEDAMPRYFLAYLFESREGKEKVNISLDLQQARMYAHILGNVHLACTKLADTEMKEPGLMMEFAIFCFKMDIISYLEKRSIKREKKGQGTFYKVLQHEQRLAVFSQLLEKSTTIRLEFWNQLKHRPNLNILHSLGLQMMDMNQQITNTWTMLNDIYSDHRPALLLYSSYLSSIIGSFEEAASLQKRIEQMTCDRGDKELSNDYIFSEDTVSIIISGGKSHSIKILKVGTGVKRLFGYAPKDLINKNISILMPKIIGKKHTDLVQEYFRTGREYTIGLTFSTFGLHRNGYIFPIRVAKQQLYSLRRGIIYVGNISIDCALMENNYILTNEKGTIEGVTKRIAEFLKITPMMLVEQKLHIQDFCPEITSEDIFSLEGSYRYYFTSVKKGGSTDLEQLTFTRQFSEEGSAEHRPNSTLIYVKDGAQYQRLKCEISTCHYHHVGLAFKIFRLPTLKVKQVNENKDDEMAENYLISKEVLSELLPHMKRWPFHGHRIFQHRDDYEMDLNKYKDKDKDKEKHRNKDKDKEEGIKRYKISQFSGNKRETEEESSKKRLETGEGKPQLTTHAGFLRTEEEEEKYQQTRNNMETKPVITTEGEVVNTEQNNEDLKEKSEINKGMIETPMSGRKESKMDIMMRGTLRKLTRMSMDVSSMTSTKTTKSRRRIEALRKQSYKDFKPSSIRNVKFVFIVLAFVLFAAIFSRFMTAYLFNKKYEILGPMMSMNAERLSVMGKIGKTIREMILYAPNSQLGTSLINAEFRDAYYNYSSLPTKSTQALGTTYKDYIINSLEVLLDDLHINENFISDSMLNFDPSNAEMVEPTNVKLYYRTANGARLRYEVSMETAILDITAATRSLITKVRNGSDLTDDGYQEYFVINNTLGEMVSLGRVARDGLLLECLRLETIQNTISTALMIGISCVLGVSLIVLFPFIRSVNRELSSMLLLLLDISKKDVKEQIRNEVKFLREIKTKTRDTIDASIYDDDMINLNNDRNRLLSADSEDDSDDSHAAKVNEGNRIKGDGVKRTKSTAHIPHKDNSWLVVLVVAVFSGAILGIYLGYDQLARNLSRAIVFQTDEFYVLTSNVYMNSYMLAYLYEYLATAKKGMCSDISCDLYIQERTINRMDEMNNMLIYHKRNKTLMSDTYSKFFREVMESNICETLPSFKLLPNCQSFLGGINTFGVFTATLQFITLSNSLFMDFKLSKGTLSDIQAYLNDPRLLNLEILDAAFLTPAITLLANQLLSNEYSMIETNTNIAIAFFAVFVIIILASTIIGGRSLLSCLSRDMYDTKAMLANLPSDVLVANESIKTYLMNSMPLANT